MALLWRPNNDGDTCGCELEVPLGGVFGDLSTPHTLVARCVQHAAMTAVQVVEENLRASRTMNRLLALAPDGYVDVDRDGRRWRNGFEPARRFDAARVMHVSLRGWSVAAREAAQVAVDVEVGAGRTRIG